MYKSKINNDKRVTTTALNVKMLSKNFLESEIEEWLCSKIRQMQITGEQYYQGNHDILQRQRTVIGPDGNLIPVSNLPNNKLVDNQYLKMIEQKVNYIFGRAFTIDTDDEKYRNILFEIFDKNFQKLLHNLAVDALNGGIAWLYPYYDEDGEFKFKKFAPYEILPFWSDEAHTQLACAVRFYEVELYSESSTQSELIQKVEIYKQDGIERFTWQRGNLIPEPENPSTQHMIFVDNDGEHGYNWQRIPLIAFKYNAKEIPLIKRVKSLQDALNALLSDFANNMQEDSRNTILIIKNYDGEDLSEFRHNLASYGAVKVKSIDGIDGGVEALQIKVDASSYEALIKTLKEAIIENAMGYSVRELQSNGTPNQMNIKSILNDLDLDSDGIETEFQAAFKNLLWFINMHLINTRMGDFTKTKLEIIFNRDTIINESEIINDIKNSTELLSEKTLISKHPYVIDVEQELKRKKEEELANSATQLPE
jgi:SPP1 family phage portal protein